MAAVEIVMRSFGALLFRFRWLFAAALLIICVIFELHGSSIGILINLMGGDDCVLLGVPRPIRSDEFMVYTPMSLSQCTTDGGTFSYFQDSLRATETDMFCIYGQPVWDIAELFRPFHWGYLVLGAAKGLSFFWCGRLIVLFMVSFEFAYRLLTRESKPLSVCYALLISFAGVVQWWFSVNSLVEMLIFGQLALVWASLFLQHPTLRERLLCSLGIAWCLGVYLLAFYPAWQIPFAYVFVAFLVGLLVKRLPESKVGARDLWFVGLVIVIVALVACYVFLFRSWDTVQAVFNTDYPGHRSSNGGGGLTFLFSYPLALLAPFDPDAIFPNASEASSFFTLFPLSLVLPLALLVKRKRANALIVSLVAAFALLELYAIVGVPDVVASVSLLGKSTAGRATIAAEFALVILLFLALPHVGELGKRERVAIVAASAVILVIGFAFSFRGMGLKRLLVLIAVVLVAMALLSWAQNKRMRDAACAVLSAIALVGGLLVNPLSMGLAGYFENAVSDAIDRESGSEDVWVTADAPIQLNNVPASLGHRTLNSVNTYPQLETWRRIDPDGRYESIYNRYAHISVELIDDSVEAAADVETESAAALAPAAESAFVLNAPDHITLRTTVDGLKELGVTRVLTSQDYSRFDGLEELDAPAGYRIYKVA